MYAPVQYSDSSTYRNPPTFGTALLFAALPVAATVAAAFPAVTAGLVVGVAAGAALQQ